MTSWIYRLYSEAGDLLYVGISDSPSSRMAGHRRRKAWWGEVTRITWDRVESRSKALWDEAVAIELEAPLYNVARPDWWLTLPAVQQAGVYEPDPCSRCGEDLGEHAVALDEPYLFCEDGTRVDDHQWPRVTQGG